MTRPRLAHLALSTTVLATLAAACVEAPDDDLGVDEAALGGTATTARPAIGRVHRDGTTASCAATLISPIMIVTGDGCIGGRASLAPFAGSTFHFVDASGVRRLVQVAEVAGFHGLAFGRLSPPIPASHHRALRRPPEVEPISEPGRAGVALRGLLQRAARGHGGRAAGAGHRRGR